MKHVITGLIAVVFLSAGCGGDEKKVAPETNKKGETVEQKAETPSNEPKQEVALRLSSNDQMKYDKSELRVPANSVVTLTLVNDGQMPKSAMGHNFVLLKKGTDVAAFGMKAIEAGIDKDHIPTSNAIIGGGEETTVTFDAPAKGSYDFICSFPGHYALMKGKLIVE